MTPFSRQSDELAVYLAQRVRELRQAAGLSQLELSRRAFGYPWHDRLLGIERGARGVMLGELWRALLSNRDCGNRLPFLCLGLASVGSRPFRKRPESRLTAGAPAGARLG